MAGAAGAARVGAGQEPGVVGAPAEREGAVAVIGEVDQELVQ
ncbi:hypothetical protein [Streptomyces sp. NPDC001601]